MGNSKYFAGIVVDKGELIDLEENGKTALNLIIEANLENDLMGEKEEVDQRVVLFNAMAEKAEDKIEEGDCIVITDGSRNPRVYTTQKGTTVSTVDIVVRRFMKVAKTKLPSILTKIKNQMFTLEDLTFSTIDEINLKEVEETLD